MEKIYFYKMTADAGAAPCIRGGTLSLAICKPMIRARARVGDVIIGFAANSLHSDNRLIFAARVTKTLSNGIYYRKSRYSGRDDRIYRFQDKHFRWRKTAKFHGPNDLSHDLGEHPDYKRANVLLSRDFKYFGKNGTDSYKVKFRRIKRAVEVLKRGHRVRQDSTVRDELLKLIDSLWRKHKRHKVLGEPTSSPTPGFCYYKTGVCGVIRVKQTQI